MKLPKLLSIYIFVLIMSLPVLAQKSNFREKFILKFGYNSVNSIRMNSLNGISNQYITAHPHFRLDINYKMQKDLDFGIYLGFSNLWRGITIIDTDNSTYTSTNYKTNALFYGINANYHILPLLIHDRKTRLDLYAAGKIGLVSEFWTESNTGEKKTKTPFLECNAGLGVGYNFTKQFGVFGEYTIGRFYNEQRTLLRGGLIFKF